MMKLLLLIVILACPFATSTVYGQDGVLKIKIGILSPQTGQSSMAGKAHDFWIDFALENVGKISADNTRIEIEPIRFDTRSKDTDCASTYQRLYEEHSDVALVLGPVRSGCVENILKFTENLAIPLISTLASATSLTQNDTSSEWFFRANGNDESRLKELIRFIDNTFGALSSQDVAIVYDNFRYADGLKSDLLRLLGNPTVKMLEISEEDSTLKLPEFVEGLRDSSSETLDLFIFGSTQITKSAIKAIENEYRDEIQRYRLYTVGASHELLEFSPAGLISVGELQFEQNQSKDFEQEYNILISRAEEQEVSFYPTVYQAARFIVPAVLKAAVEAQGSELTEELLDIQALRKEVKNLLETKDFESLQPPKRLSFNRGEMVTSFSFPIYEVTSQLKRIDKPQPNAGWVEFTESKVRIKFMESPIKVTVIGHQLEGTEVIFYLTKDNEQIDELAVAIENGKATDIFFNTIAFGDYYVGTNVASSPKAIAVSVYPSPLYLVCALAACVGVLLRRQFSGVTWQRRFGFIIEGVLTAMILAFTATYLQLSVAQMISSERISGYGSSLVDGLMYGFVGGWFGPQLIQLAIEKVVPRASGSQSQV